MSRYVHVRLELHDLTELHGGLQALGHAPELNPQGQQIMLEGSLECPGEPVDLRLPAGTCGTVEDFGFVARDDGRIELVCGELDRSRLREHLLGPLQQHLARQQVEAAARRHGMVTEQTVESDGTRRIVLKRR